MQIIKQLSVIIIFLFIYNCGYSPLYSQNQKINFYIKDLVFENGDDELVSFTKSRLNNYLKVGKGKKFKIKSKIVYEKKSSSKNTAGETEEYELIVSSEFIINTNNLSTQITLAESFRMENFNDEFEERQYEREIKRTMAQIIANKLVIKLSQLSRTNDN